MATKPRLGDTLVELHVSRNYSAFDYDIYITERQVGGDSFVWNAAGDRVKVERGAVCPPTVTIPEHMAGDLVGQLLKMGVVPEGKAAPQDLLDAKDAHMRDLRALVFKGKVEPRE
jgi:hypothetical protein